MWSSHVTWRYPPGFTDVHWEIQICIPIAHYRDFHIWIHNPNLLREYFVMRVLKVYAGPNPNDVHELQPLTAHAPTAQIESPNFRGEISLYLRTDDTPTQVTKTSNQGQGPMKNFSFQAVGQFNYIPPEHPLYDPDKPQMWNFDDVLFAVELDKPVPWSSVPVPQWIINGVYRWLKRMNAAVVIDGVFTSDSPVANESGLDVEAFQHQIGKKPEINVPLVCAANTMNMWSEEWDWDSLTREYLGTPNIMNHAHQDRRQFEWSLISFLDRPIWSNQKMNHQFPRELVEFNAYLFPESNPPKDKHPSFRRAHFRETIAVGSAGTHSWFSVLKDRLQTTVHLEQTRTCQWTTRSLHHFQPGLTYGFDFYADYFDFRSFTLRPKVQPSPAGMTPPKGILDFLTGRWQIDVGKYLKSTSKTAADAGKPCSRLTLSCKSRPFTAYQSDGIPRQQQIYFWTIVFEMMED